MPRNIRLELSLRWSVAFVLVKTFLIILCVTAMASCGDNPFVPLLRGQRFNLRAVNGQPLPASPNASLQIVEGWIQVDNDSMAERHEKHTGTIGLGDGWTRPGRYTIRHDTLFIVYGPTCPSCGPGPEYPADTFTVSGSGLLRRELFPPDSVVRYYSLP